MTPNPTIPDLEIRWSVAKAEMSRLVEAAQGLSVMAGEPGIKVPKQTQIPLVAAVRAAIATGDEEAFEAALERWRAAWSDRIDAFIDLEVKP